MQPVKPAAGRVVFIIAFMLVVGVLHYGEFFGLTEMGSFTSHIGLSRHTIDRILLLIPVAWAGYSYGFGAGLATATAALALMVPRAVLISPEPGEAMIETIGVALSGSLVCLWLETQRRQRRAAARLQTAQHDLQANVRLLRSHQKRLAALNSISTMLTHSMELKRLLEVALDMVMDVMETEIALIFSPDEERKRLTLIARRGVSEKFARIADESENGLGFGGVVARTGAPLFVDDVSRDPRFTRAAVEERIQTMLVVPLKVKGTVTGILCLADRHSRQYGPEEMELINAIGAHLGIAIENSRLYSKERLLAARYRSIFDNANDAIWVHDMEGHILTANGGLAELTGYTAEELAVMECTKFFMPEDLARIREMEMKLLRNDVQGDTREVRARKKNGAEMMVELTTTVFSSDGPSPGVQHIARDVTEAKRAQDNLRFYSQAVTKAQEQERNRIARDLHDETIQQLIAISHQIEDFMLYGQSLSPEDSRFLSNLRQRLRDTLEGVRRFSRDLRPPMLDDLGLVSSLEWWISQLPGAGMPDVKLRVVGDACRFAPEAELLVFRITQEALINVRRHARATHAEVVVTFAQGETVVAVRDDGKGFEPAGLAADPSRTGKLGLIGMEERARLLGATLSIDSRPGRGTVVTLEVPVIPVPRIPPVERPSN